MRMSKVRVNQFCNKMKVKKASLLTRVTPRRKLDLIPANLYVEKAA